MTLNLHSRISSVKVALAVDTLTSALINPTIAGILRQLTVRSTRNRQPCAAYCGPSLHRHGCGRPPASGYAHHRAHPNAAEG